MSKPLDQILDRRRQRQGASEQRRTTVVSLLFHTLIVVAVWLVPDLLAKPPEPFKYVAVTVVPPSVLGQEEVPPPPPPPPDLPPPVDTPPPPDPEPEPEPEAPVLVKETKQAQPKPQPRQAPPAPPPPVRKPPPKRQGSPFGKSLGASHRNTTVGVEDPNFTYGFYLDRVVALISQHWKRPLEDPDVVQAAFYFRIRDDGSLSELRLVTSSGSQTFDGAAEQAVRAAPPFPPLPKQYTKKFGRDYLGINLIIK